MTTEWDCPPSSHSWASVVGSGAGRESSGFGDNELKVIYMCLPTSAVKINSGLFSHWNIKSCNEK